MSGSAYTSRHGSLLLVGSYLATGLACAALEPPTTPTFPTGFDGFDSADTAVGTDTDGAASNNGGNGLNNGTDPGTNTPPRAVINRPTGDILPGDPVPLDGTASTDRDGDPLTYLWEIVGKPSSSSGNLSNATSAQAELFVDVDGEYTVQLTVDDGQANDSATAKLTVLKDNLPPIANAGIDQRVAQFSTVQLNGAQSSDPDGDSLEFYWTFISAPAGFPSLQGNSSPTTATSPSFVADQLGIYTLELEVGDGTLRSFPDTVQISVYDPSPAGNASTSSSSGGCDLGCAEAVDQVATTSWTAGGLASSAGLMLLPIFVVLWHRRRDEE